MGRIKREPMNPAKKNIVSELIKTYDIKTAKDIQESLKDLLDETLQDLLEAEINEHLGYDNILGIKTLKTAETVIRVKKLEAQLRNLR